MLNAPRKRVILIIVVLLLFALMTFWLRKPAAISIESALVSRGNVEESIANTRAGTVKACRRAGLSPAIGGQIQSLNVQKGHRVKAGQVLLEMWNDDLLAEYLLAQNEAKTASARAEEACVTAAVSRHEADRLTKLHQNNLASEEVTDRAVGDAKAKSAACKASRASSEVSEARIQVVLAALERSRLRAPFDGTVAEINGELGEFVTPSPVGVPTLPAVDLVDDRCLYILAPIDEVDAPRVKIDMTARITLDAFPGQSFVGRVRRVASYVLDRERQARTVDIEVQFSTKSDTLTMLPGYSADVEVLLSTRNNVLRVPTLAIKEGNTVFVIQEDQTLAERKIETGLSNWNFTEIRSGLDQDESIVTSIDRTGIQAGAYVESE